MSADSVRPIVVLMAEDNRADVVLFREAVEASQTAAEIHVVTNGAEAMRFLRRKAPFDRAPRPDIVVLDLNLPLKNGQEVIVEMAAEIELNTIPVAILTTSTSETCICELYPAGRCLYLTKTDDFKRLQDIVRQIATQARTTGAGIRLR
jgi:CheY-like chemotaxis protein